MNGTTRIPRLAALAGAGFFVLATIGHFTYPDAPDFMAKPAAVQAFYVSHENGVLASNTLFVLSAMLLLVFTGALRTALRRADGEHDGTLARIVSSGLVAAVALLIASAAADLAGALHVQEQGTIAPQSASVLWDLDHVLQGLAAPMALAVAVLGCALAAFRDRALPAWFGALSVPLGVALAIPPINYVAFTVFTFWALAGSLVLAVRERAVAEPAIAGARL